MHMQPTQLDNDCALRGACDFAAVQAEAAPAADADSPRFAERAVTGIDAATSIHAQHAVCLRCQAAALQPDAAAANCSHSRAIQLCRIIWLHSIFVQVDNHIFALETRAQNALDGQVLKQHVAARADDRVACKLNDH